MAEKRSDTSASGKTFVRGKTIDDDERRRGRPQAARVIRRVVQSRRETGFGRHGKIGGAFKGRLPLRPIPKGPPNKESARRMTVKVSYVRNKKPGQWAKHGKYLEREGTQKDQSAGAGFDARSDTVDLPATLNAWQLSDDPRLFKVVLSPEDGDRLDLHRYTREYMAKLAPHLSEKPEQLEWAAVAHYNTGHPHVHVLLRGHHNLQIPRELLQHGMRNLGSEIATEHLGYRSPAEIATSQQKTLDARRLTPVDREIDRLSHPLPDGRHVITEGPLLPADHGYDQQRLRIGRLESLERMGLAEKAGHVSWIMDKGWTQALRDLQTLQTRTEMIAQSRALMTEPRCVPQVTKLKPGERLVGRVLGAGMDEKNDRHFLLIEGTDYRAHILYQNATIEKARDAGELQLRHLVAIEGKSFEGQGKAIHYTKTTDYGLAIPDKPTRAPQIPEQALDDALDAGAKIADEAPTGFQRFWHEQLLAKAKKREKANEKEKAEKQARQAEMDAAERTEKTAEIERRGTTNPDAGFPAKGGDPAHVIPPKPVRKDKKKGRKKGSEIE